MVPGAATQATPDPAGDAASREIEHEDASPEVSLRELGRPAVVASVGCPFLVAEAGAWRLAAPTRDHRCSAFLPPTALAPEKQARLCLTDAHIRCATYVASVEAREARLGLPVRNRTTRWALARTTSVIEESGGPVALFLSLVRDRRRWPAIPAVILVTTLLTLAISGFRGGVPGAAVSTLAPTPSPTAVGTPTAAPTPAPTPSPAPSPTPAPSATATPAPSPTPAPSHRTYIVKSGDSLSAIAAKFGTTVKAIADLNNISDPARLRIGQVLLIP